MTTDLSVFFDDFISRGLTSMAKSSYPPVNIYRVDDNIVLEVAVAGFSKDQLSVDFDGQQITVSGKKMQPDQNNVFLVRELSSRAFSRRFAISGQYEPDSPTLENGILTIVLKGQNTKRALQIIDKSSNLQLTG